MVGAGADADNIRPFADIALAVLIVSGGHHGTLGGQPHNMAGADFQGGDVPPGQRFAQVVFSAAGQHHRAVFPQGGGVGSAGGNGFAQMGGVPRHGVEQPGGAHLGGLTGGIAVIAQAHEQLLGLVVVRAFIALLGPGVGDCLAALGSIGISAQLVKGGNGLLVAARLRQCLGLTVVQGVASLDDLRQLLRRVLIFAQRLEQRLCFVIVSCLEFLLTQLIAGTASQLLAVPVVAQLVIGGGGIGIKPFLDHVPGADIGDFQIHIRCPLGGIAEIAQGGKAILRFLEFTGTQLGVGALIAHLLDPLSGILVIPQGFKGSFCLVIFSQRQQCVALGVAHFQQPVGGILVVPQSVEGGGCFIVFSFVQQLLGGFIAHLGNLRPAVLVIPQHLKLSGCLVVKPLVQQLSGVGIAAGLYLLRGIPEVAQGGERFHGLLVFSGLQQLGSAVVAIAGDEDFRNQRPQENHGQQDSHTGTGNQIAAFNFDLFL